MGCGGGEEDEKGWRKEKEYNDNDGLKETLTVKVNGPHDSTTLCPNYGSKMEKEKEKEMEKEERGGGWES
ncbi:hypothetical protein M0802_000939 [Mischocyttarus mexicanus]|nr:hypothetical protein M0802_000939 [Mischocyttarus mexicanus]